RLAEAIVLYRRGVDLGAISMHKGDLQAPSQALHLLGLAVALDRDEQQEKAMATARHALELDAPLSQLHDAHVFFVPEGDIVYYEAIKELAEGRRTEAARSFAQFLRLVPQSPFAARARAHVAALGGKLPPAGRTQPPREASQPSMISGGVVLVRGPL